MQDKEVWKVEISMAKYNIHNNQVRIPVQSRSDIFSEPSDAKNKRFQGQDTVENREIGKHLGKRVTGQGAALEKPMTELRFSVHEKTGRISVTVINSENHEIIREIPSEKLLDIAAGMNIPVGIFVDKRA